MPRESFEGDEAEAQRWLPLARQELFKLELRMSTQGQVQGHARVKLADDAECLLYSIPGGIRGIHIIAKPGPEPEVSLKPYFEFATSAFPIRTESVHQEFAEFDSYNGCIIGVELSVFGSTVTPKPVIRGSDRTSSGADFSLIGRPFQESLINEPVAYPRPANVGGIKTYPLMVFESWAPGNPHTGVPIRNTEFPLFPLEMFHTGPTTQYLARDINFDVPFAKGVNRAKIRTAYLRGDADWPRASGIQTVTAVGVGTREFAIYVDAFNQFFVFPTASIEAVSELQQNVADGTVRMETPHFPDWCYLPTEKLSDYSGSGVQGLVDFPELDWKFNRTGTKAVSIVYERSPVEFDASYWAQDARDPPNAFTQDMFDQIMAKMGVLGRDDYYGFADDYNTAKHFTAPGIIEVAVKIELFGPGPTEFDLSLEVREVRKPSTMTDWSVAVGYCWHDITRGEKKITKDDLISVDIERWSPKTGDIGNWTGSAIPGGGFFTGIGSNKEELLSFKQLDKDPVDEAFCLLARPLLALDLRTMSFVTQAYSLLPRADRAYLGVAVYFGGVLQEILLPKSPATQADKDDMRKWALMDGREFMAGFVAIDPRWQRVPANPPDDRWNDPALVGMRDYFARSAEHFRFQAGDSSPFSGAPFGVAQSYDIYKTGSIYTFDTIPVRSAQEDVYGRWQTDDGIGNGMSFCFFTTAPRWGWTTYASLAAGVMWLNPYVTFYTHPNGTWAYWDNTNVYVPDRMPAIGYDGFDPKLVEHVIFDRIHFEIPRSQSRRATADTTFFDLYNAAVDKAEEEHSTFGIDRMTDEDLRATFGKLPVFEFHSEVIPPVLLEWVDLAMSWDGGTWFRPDSLTHQLGTLAEARYRGGQFRGLRTDQLWYTEPFYLGSREAPAEAKRHVRFANPILVGA